MAAPIVTTYALPPGQPVMVPTFYVSEAAVQASSNDVTMVLHDIMPVAGPHGVDPDVQVRRPIAVVKMSPQTLKGLAQALSAAVRAYEDGFGMLNIGDVEREGE